MRIASIPRRGYGALKCCANGHFHSFFSWFFSCLNFVSCFFFLQNIPRNYFFLHFILVILDCLPLQAVLLYIIATHFCALVLFIYSVLFLLRANNDTEGDKMNEASQERLKKKKKKPKCQPKYFNIANPFASSRVHSFIWLVSYLTP